MAPAGWTLVVDGPAAKLMATRKNDDGTLSMVTIDRGPFAIPFVVETRGGKRVLVLRDAQHEYVFTEAT